jgi:protein SCO1/2
VSAGRVPSVAAGVLWLIAVAPGAAAPLPHLGAAPNFALTTQQNDRLWLTQLRDRLVVLTFTCTGCDDTCPGLLPGLRALSREVGEAAGRRVFFVAVTVDPTRDTATVLRRYAYEQGLDPAAWLLLTGKPAEVDVVTRRYGVGVRRTEGRVSPDCLVVLIDQAGVIRGRYGVADLERLRAELAALLTP